MLKRFYTDKFILKIWRFRNNRPTTKKLFTISAKNMQTVTAWVNMIGIRVKNKTLWATKSSLFESVMESIIEREETFEYSLILICWVVGVVRVAYICEKYTIKSTLPIEGELCPRSKCRWVRYVCPIPSFWMIISISVSTRWTKRVEITVGSIACSLLWVSLFQFCKNCFSAGIRMSEL